MRQQFFRFGYVMTILYIYYFKADIQDRSFENPFLVFSSQLPLYICVRQPIDKPNIHWREMPDLSERLATGVDGRQVSGSFIFHLTFPLIVLIKSVSYNLKIYSS